MSHQITLSLVALILGLMVLGWSADRFVESSVALATRFGISPLLIGITIIGFGTSAPEMLVSAMAALQNTPGIAVGNAIGSNIANIALIIGVSALLCPITSSQAVIRREFPVMAGVTLFASTVMLNGYLSRLEGILFLIAQVVLLIFAYYSAQKDKQVLQHTAPPEETIQKLSYPGIWLTLSFLLLILSSRALVWGAVNIATSFGVSSLVIGLTIIALGTSLPELAASIAASRKGHSDLVLGNILGSNAFNLMSVLGISALISPAQLETAVLTRDIPVMCVITFLFWAFAFKIRGSGMIGRVKGAILLSLYAGYQVLLYFAATQVS